jgi:hypothetical protein
MNYNSDTLKLLNVINSIDYKKYKNIHKIKITKNKFLNDLYKKLSLILNNSGFNNSLKNISITKLNTVPKMQDNKFTSELVNKDIEKMKYGYLIQFDNNKIYYYSKNNIKNIKNIKNRKNKILENINHICRVIKSLKILFHRERETQIVHFYMTDKKKQFPKNKSTTLGPNESNSGVTFSNFVESGEITIYRSEEHLKVLIHELIHSNFIDKELIFINKTLEKQFNEYFCTNYTILLNEAFTETMATLLNLFYIHISKKLKKKDLDIMFNNEFKYSIYIYSKIMKYYNVDNINQILKKDKGKCISNFPQQTNIIAYYLFKPLLLLNIVEFTDLYEKYSVNYKINNEFVENFAKLIINNISDLNKLLINKNILDKDESSGVFRKLQPRQNLSVLLYPAAQLPGQALQGAAEKNNSLRMTLYEL